MISAIFFGALEGQTILDCFHGFVSRLRNLKEDGLKIGDFSFDLPPDWIAFPGIWGIEEPLKSFLGGLRIPEDFWGTRSPGISLETERFIGADFSRNSSYIGLDCFLGFFLEFYYSLFFVHMYLNLTRYGWLCFTEVSSVFFMKQETMCFSDFAFLKKHELHNAWALGIFEIKKMVVFDEHMKNIWKQKSEIIVSGFCYQLM